MAKVTYKKDKKKLKVTQLCSGIFTIMLRNIPHSF